MCRYIRNLVQCSLFRHCTVRGFRCCMLQLYDLKYMRLYTGVQIFQILSSINTTLCRLSLTMLITMPNPWTRKILFVVWVYSSCYTLPEINHNNCKVARCSISRSCKVGRSRISKIDTKASTQDLFKNIAPSYTFWCMPSRLWLGMYMAAQSVSTVMEWFYPNVSRWCSPWSSIDTFHEYARWKIY